MKKIILIVLTIFLMLPLVKASHVIGGDIHIEWVSQNNYNLKLRFYRDDINAGLAQPLTMDIGLYEVGTNNAIDTFTLNRTSLGLIPLGDGCYVPDPTQVAIEEGIFETTVPVFIPNNAAGYYLSTQINARNSLATNVQTGGTMTWFAMMADPAIGQNSSPDFGNYPNDAYFCTFVTKFIQYPITDSDGDSLAYSLVTPLDAWSGTNGPSPGMGAYPYYPPLSFVGPYNLGNIIGGATPMAIDPVTGLIIAAPTIATFFTFAVLVEEFRDIGSGIKVKIGETRRDIQYRSENCGAQPQFLPNNLNVNFNDTILVEYNKEICEDFVSSYPSIGDTNYMELISDLFDSNAVILLPPVDGSGQYHYFYNNGLDSIVKNANLFDPNLGLEYDTVGSVALRFCWTPECSTIGKTYPFIVRSFSPLCNGTLKDSLFFYFKVTDPAPKLANVSFKPIAYGSEYCKSIIFEDTSLVDLLNIKITSTIFDEGAEYPDLSANYEYTNFENPGLVVVTGVPNGAPNTQSLGIRFCWTPDCDHIGGTFEVEAILSSLDCPDPFRQDTMKFDLLVTPPFDSLDVVPNVITPNGDGINDVYRIGGVSNFCNDKITVEIFNRWGNSVYKSEEPTFEWDGTNKGGGDVPAGTYFVLVSGIYGSETVTLDQRSVTILR